MPDKPVVKPLSRTEWDTRKRSLIPEAVKDATIDALFDRVERLERYRAEHAKWHPDQDAHMARDCGLED